MLNFEINIKQLNEELEGLSGWDDWYRIEKEIFRQDDWPQTSIDDVDEDLDRPVQIINGEKWESTTNFNDVSPEIYHLYEKTRCIVFNKLEPEAAEENRNHPEWYGKWCVYCKMWTRKYDNENCPKCGNELLPLTLNED